MSTQNPTQPDPKSLTSTIQPDRKGVPRPLGTVSVHGREPRQKAFDAIPTPIACTATYAFANTKELIGYFEGETEREEYGRYGNPTVRAAELKVAALDNAEDAALFGSGMAAITTSLLALLRSGDHVVMTSDCYRRTRQFVTVFLARFGVEATLVPPGDPRLVEAAIRKGKTRLIIAESPTNPYLRIADIPALAAIRARTEGCNLLIDSTFATPVNQRPLELGADLVLHSCTKYHAGHNDLLAGAICGSAPLVSLVRDLRGVLGGVLDPHAAFLLSRGMKTLSLRVERQNESALRVARFLESHPNIREVYYPGLESHADHALAKSQMGGSGGVISFRVQESSARASALIDACKLATLAPSLGGVETLIEQPSLMSFYEMTTDERLAIGIYDDLIRLSVGIEECDDIIEDLSQALDKAFATPLSVAATG